MIENIKQSLITTNVRIPKEELLTYREYALSEGKSFSQLVREILAQAVMPAYAKTKVVTKKKKRSFWDIGKYAISIGDKKASQTADKYIYQF